MKTLKTHSILSQRTPKELIQKVNVRLTTSTSIKLMLANHRLMSILCRQYNSVSRADKISSRLIDQGVSLLTSTC